LVLYDKQLTLVGDDSMTTIISGHNSGRVLLLYANSMLTMRGVTIRDGRIADNQGGGIYNDGILTIDRSRIVDNTASVSGGGIANFGTLSISRSTLAGNRVMLGNGGAIVNGGQVTVSTSIIVGNHAEGSGGGIYHSVGAFSMTNSIVTNNRADLAGGGIANFDHMELANSTISANSTAGAGGGVLNGGHVTVASLSLTNNRATDGSSIYNGGTLVIDSAITSGAKGSATCTNWGVVFFRSMNLRSDTHCGPIAPRSLNGSGAR
jgi:hypothetical protein